MPVTISFIRGAGRAAKLAANLSELSPKERWRLKQSLDLCAFRGKYALLPASPRHLEWLSERLPNIVLEPDVRSWYDQYRQWENSREKAKTSEYADLEQSPAREALWAFQKQGVNFILEAKRLILADAPGLGKTAQAVAAISEDNFHRRVLIVCPHHLRHFWEAEIIKWWGIAPTPNITVCEAATRRLDWETYKRQRGFFIVNWELLRLMPKLQEGAWQYVVCDEAHRVKNRKTQMYKALSKIKTPRLILVTGTPFANNAGELWTLLHLIRPDIYTSYWRFYEMYVDYERHPYLGFRRIIGVRNPHLLGRELAPYMLRRLKDEVINLPDKVYTTIPLDLTSRQRRMYQDLVREAITELEGGAELTVTNAISLITRLRQIVSTTATLEETDHSTKLDAAVEMIEDYYPTKVVVFSQFRNTVDALCSRLDKAGIPNLKLMGGLGADRVNAIVESFQEDDLVRVLVATTATGGEGLTLTASSILIFLEKHYNPAKQQQAEDRIHRIGQTRKCNIISLHCRRTVDDLVQQILDRKEADITAVLIEHLQEVMNE